METPNTRAGQITERIMSAWSRKLDQRKEPKPSTATYNAAYEAVLEVLDQEGPPRG